MFCENCGHQVREGERFCEACGAQLQPVQPVQQQPVQQPVQQPSPFDAPTQKYEPAPKKPMSKKTKMILLFSGIGAAVIIAFLIVLFTVIIPSMKKAGKLDLKDYITVTFNVDEYSDSKHITDGKILGMISPDFEKFFADQKLAPDTDTYNNALYAFYWIADITCEKTVGEKSSVDTSDVFYNAKASDVFTVTIKWPETATAKSEMQLAEDMYGVGFNTEPQTFQFKLGDELSKQGIEIVTPKEIDLLGYIKENDLIVTEGDTDGKLSVFVEDFETTIGGFKFTHDGGLDVDIYDKTGNHLDYFYLEFSKSSNLKNGDKVTLNYEEYNTFLEKYGISLVGDPIEYTVKSDAVATAPTTAPSTTAPATTVPATTEAVEEGLSVEDAKANVEPLKTYFLKNVISEDYQAKNGDQIEAKAMYYCHSKDTRYRRIVFIYENKTGKYFKAIEALPESMSVVNGKIENENMYFSPSEAGKTLEEATENNWYLSSTYKSLYNNTKIF